MLTLSDGRNELWQWDTGRTLTVNAECSQVHFSNKVFGRSIDVYVTDGTAIIPDILLQADKELTAWAFVGTPENGYTKISKVFKVNKRNKPADYVFTPPEQTALAEIMERLDDIESAQGPDAIKNAVDDYLANNPIKVEETDPTVPAWAKQPQKPRYTAAEVGAQPKGDYVLYTEQNLTEEQKAQARENIGIPEIVCPASGDVIAVTDSLNRNLRGLNLFGKTTQNGTPTPESPVELESVGDDGNILVYVTDGTDENVQTLSVPTPHGLPGIPVSSGGNYNDDNGQQWICDEIDLARGVYVHRVGATTIDGTRNWNMHGGNSGDVIGFWSTANLGQKAFGDATHGVFSHFSVGRLTHGTAFVGKDTIQCWMNSEIASTAAEIKTWFTANHVKVMYALATPIETDLTEEELTAYATLHTNYTNTTVYNDEGAGMAVKYVADTKLYIDNKFTELQNAILSAGANV